MESPIVEVEQGKLRGTTGVNQLGENYFRFHSIPYSNPPARFQAGDPPRPWTGIRNATEENGGCYSTCVVTDQITGSEDCLYLNVYTKTLPHAGSELKAVMVWIYGGSYIRGHSKTNLYGPNFFMTEDIVLVTINYRVGIIGFLNFEDDSLPAVRNLGLKDQRLALEWIQKNIHMFGGDPNNVTLFGESAGASGVHYHILSGESKGLFHKAILQSGCALSVFGLGELNLIKIVETMGHKVNSEKEAFDILVKASIEDIYNAQKKYAKFIFPSRKRIVSPVIEPEGAKSPIITQPAKNIIQSGQYNDVPCIFGYNADEGMFIDVNHLVDSKNEWEFEKFLPYQMDIDQNSNLAKQLGRKIKEKFLRDGEDFEASLHKLATDIVFVTWILASIKQHVKTSKQPLYAYKMTLETQLNATKQLGLVTAPGVAHFDDIGYLFTGSKTPNIEKDSVEDLAWKRFIKLWTNFAKYGNPTPNIEEFGITWEPVKTPDELRTMIIGNELKMKTNPDEEVVRFWNDIFKNCPNTSDLF